VSEYLKRWKDILTGTLKEGSLFIGAKPYGGRTYPEVTWAELNNVHRGDPDTRAAIDFITDIAVGMGFQTVMNPNYKTKSLEGKTAKEIVDEKCKEHGVDELHQEVCRDLVGYGNSFVWKGETGKELVRISPAIISNFEWDTTARIQKLLNVVTVYREKFSADELLWYSFNRIGKTGLGVGILQTLCTPLDTGDGERPSFAQIKARIQRSMVNQIENMGAYNELWVLGGISDKKLQEYYGKIEGLKKSEGRRIVINPKRKDVPDTKVIQLIPERMRGLDFYVETLWNSYFLALETPLPKLFTSPGFTEASAKAAVAFGERKIYSLQRYLKRMDETYMFDRWVLEAGLEPFEAQVRLNWRLPERPKVEDLLPLLFRTWEAKGMTTEEWRKILINIGVDIQETLPPEVLPFAEPKTEKFLPGEKPIPTGKPEEKPLEKPVSPAEE